MVIEKDSQTVDETTTTNNNNTYHCTNIIQHNKVFVAAIAPATTEYLLI
jgi:hypothetical protein